MGNSSTHSELYKTRVTETYSQVNIVNIELIYCLFGGGGGQPWGGIVSFG